MGMATVPVPVQSGLASDTQRIPVWKANKHLTVCLATALACSLCKTKTCRAESCCFPTVPASVICGNGGGGASVVVTEVLTQTSHV